MDALHTQEKKSIFEVCLTKRIYIFNKILKNQKTSLYATEIHCIVINFFS